MANELKEMSKEMQGYSQGEIKALRRLPAQTLFELRHNAIKDAFNCAKHREYKRMESYLKSARFYSAGIGMSLPDSIYRKVKGTFYESLLESSSLLSPNYESITGLLHRGLEEGYLSRGEIQKIIDADAERESQRAAESRKNSWKSVLNLSEES